MVDWIQVSPLGDLLVRAAQRSPERTALVFPDERYRYADLLAGAQHVAHGLHALGVRSGDHVGLLMPNCVEYVEAFFGASLLGAVVVPLNARYKLTELGYVIAHADLVTILTTDLIEDHVDFTNVLHESLPGLADADVGSRVLRIVAAPRLRSAVMLRGESKRGFLGRRAFDELAATADHDTVAAQRRRVRVRDLATILYTSGTTSNPKGCMLSHEAISCGPVARVTERVPSGEANVFWSAGPLFHIGSLQLLIASVGLGGTYLADTHFDPSRALEMMKREGVTSAWPWFPVIMQALLADPSFDEAALETIRSIMLIGSPALLSQVQSLFPQTQHINACGMTETAGAYAISATDDTAEERAGTGGLALDGLEVRIIDPDTGEDLPDGATGEILVRGYSVMDGYYRDPDKTAAVIDSDGWFHTSDLYSRRPTGHLTFHGRAKDMLKVGGENVAAVEVESFLCQHPAVKLAEVVGAPDPRLDEVPVAFVELKDGHALEPGQLIEFCRGRIASFKVPRAVHIMTETDWPMSATKVDKTALRGRLTSTAEIIGTA
jgi:fatty-acyl-CoA synthase/long-chain acyl-CoA synthetase